MIYYLPLLKIKGFDESIIKKLDSLFLKASNSIMTKFSPKFLSKELEINELDSFKLLLQCVKVGAVDIRYEVCCPNCHSILKNVSNYQDARKVINCDKCKGKGIIISDENIFVYFSLLLGKKSKMSEMMQFKKLMDNIEV